ncbi:MAG: ankyrin repeat domain-containing protein [Saprospiraceae bacterium]|nr:ankyrin repeat domain-containing protein [Saprospiraceae bacterium]
MRATFLIMIILLFAGLDVIAQSSTEATENNQITQTSAPDDKPKSTGVSKLTEEELTRMVFDAINAKDSAQLIPLLNALMYYRHNEAGETALTQAIVNKDPMMVGLLAREAVINLKNKAGETPLTLALKLGNLEIIQLISQRAKAGLKNDKDESPLMLTIERFDDLFLLQELIDKGADVNNKSNGITPIARATELGKIQTVALLLRNGADASKPNANGELPLFIAVQHNFDAIAGMLLYKSKQAEKDANWKNKIGETLLNLAATQGNGRLVNILLEYGADPKGGDYLENTGLHIAAEKGNIEMARTLLEKGAPADQPNMLGTTPIMAAAQNKHNEIAKLLAEYGANPERRNFAGIAANDFGVYSIKASIQAQYEQLVDSQLQTSKN